MSLIKSSAIFLAAWLCVAVSTDRARADTFGSTTEPFYSFTVDFVTIGNPGNVADTTGRPNPAGSVPYAYRIAKFEITQWWVDIANILGGLSLARSNRDDLKPVTGITWNETSRFVNWLNTSKGFHPAYKFAIQPTENGYNENINPEPWSPGDPGYDPNNIYRNSLAQYFLPTENEWYKAAYYKPSTGAYSDYATGSDTEPTAVFDSTSPNSTVYKQSLEIGPSYYNSAGSLSPYGTMAQGGNVAEWTETKFDNSMSAPRSVRGGNWHNFQLDISSFARFGWPQSTRSDEIGFRVASVAVPEPSSIVLLIAATIASRAARRRAWSSGARKRM